MKMVPFYSLDGVLIGHVDREILDWYFHLADAESQEAMRRLSQAAELRKQAE